MQHESSSPPHDVGDFCDDNADRENDVGDLNMMMMMIIAAMAVRLNCHACPADATPSGPRSLHARDGDRDDDDDDDDGDDGDGDGDGDDDDDDDIFTTHTVSCTRK